MRYAIKLIPADGVYIATCRDLPAFNSVGDTQEEALHESVDALALALQGHIDEYGMPPKPSAKLIGEHWISLSSLGVDGRLGRTA